MAGVSGGCPFPCGDGSAAHIAPAGKISCCGLPARLGLRLSARFKLPAAGDADGSFADSGARESLHTLNEYAGPEAEGSFTIWKNIHAGQHGHVGWNPHVAYNFKYKNTEYNGILKL